MGAAPLVLLDRFELGDRLGHGSLSVVHAATDRVTGRSVAVKLALGSRDDQAAVRRRFAREAEALAVIASAHVVELISAGTTPDDRPFLVLERLEGRDLQEVLAATGPLKPARVVQFIGQAATALELAHGLGIVHRDLKPANLFVQTEGAQRGTIKVLDFGLVVDVAGPTERNRDAFGGTPLYMAPEQVRGQLSRIGPATDIWALGLVTLTLLTGEVYWEGRSAEAVMLEIEESALVPPSRRWPWLPPTFDAWFARSTRRVPERRFRSVADQAAELAVALRGVEPPARLVAGAASDAAETLTNQTPSVVRRSGYGSTVVGRQLETGEIAQVLAPGAVVTLTGPAGIGKTRLARALCEAVGDRYDDGAWFVPLAAREGAEPIESAIAHALELEPDTTRPIREHVAAALAPRRVLIAVDGVEQVGGAAAAIARLAAACPGVAWLATARLPLGIDRERCVRIEPLELPPPAPISAGEAETFAAVTLFVRRVRETVSGFALDDDNVEDVVAICRAVEGFPLGIELAAAQLPTSTPAQVRAALERDESASGAPVDRSSIRHAVTWSYGLLAADDQALLRHLAIWPAGLTFEQVRRHLGHLCHEIAPALLRLVHSHLLSWSDGEPRRVVMLDTVRELCRDRSQQAGEEATLWEVAYRHAMEVAGGLAGAAAPDAWLQLVDAEHDNLRAVLAHLLAVSPSAAMRLAGDLAWYWYLRGHYAEGSRWLEEAIARSGGGGGGTGTAAGFGEDRIRALQGAGRLALLTCRYERAAQLLERARTIAHDGGDRRAEASALQLLGSVARERGDYDRARALHRRALSLWEELGDPGEAARARNYLVFAAWLGDPAGDPRGEERAWWQHDAEAALRDLGDAEASVWSLLNRGAILHHAGDRGGAREVLGRAFAGAIAARFHEGIAWSLDLLGRASLERGEHLQARAQLAASLRVHRRLGDLWRCASVLEALAAVAETTDRPARGAVYLGAADALRQQIGAPVPTCERALLAATERHGLAAVGDAFRTGRERGARTPLDRIVELARDTD
jgi:predicted ATPase